MGRSYGRREYASMKDRKQVKVKVAEGKDIVSDEASEETRSQP
jgi:hypothetical protein